LTTRLRRKGMEKNQERIFRAGVVLKSRTVATTGRRQREEAFTRENLGGKKKRPRGFGKIPTKNNQQNPLTFNHIDAQQKTETVGGVVRREVYSPFLVKIKPASHRPDDPGLPQWFASGKN